MIAWSLALIIAPLPAFAGVPCPPDPAERKAPCTASQSEKDYIMEFVEKGLKAHEDYVPARTKADLLWEAADAIQDKTSQAYLKAAEAWFDAEEGKVQLEAKMNSHFKEAIRLTRGWYGLPYLGELEGTIANGPMEGQSAKWEPEFLYLHKNAKDKYETVDFDMVRHNPDKIHYSDTKGLTPDKYLGMTDSDGKVRMLVSAFQAAKNQGHPGILAATLHHELAHFRELTGPGSRSVEEAEANALAETVKANKRDLFELPKDVRDSNESKKAKYDAMVRRAKEQPNRYKLTNPFKTPAQEAEIAGRLALKEKLEEAREELKSQVEKSRKERAEAERERAREAERLREEAERAQRDAAKAGYASLAMVLGREECLNPGSVGQGRLDGLADRDQSFYRELLREHPIEWGKSCAQDFSREMLIKLAKGEPLTRSWLTQFKRDRDKLLDYIEDTERSRAAWEERARRSRWLSLRAWAAVACAYMEPPGPMDPEWGHPDLIQAREARAHEYLLTHLAALSTQDVAKGIEDLPGTTPACHRWVLRLIHDAPGPLSAEWLLDRIEHEKRGGRIGEVIRDFLGAVGRAIQNGEAAVDKSVSAPFASNGRDGPSEENRPDEAGGKGRRPEDWDSYRQLRGVSSGGWKR